MKYVSTDIMCCEGAAKLSETRIISVKIPEQVYQEMALRIPEGDRSNFVREAIQRKTRENPQGRQGFGFGGEDGKDRGGAGSNKKVPC